MLLKFIPKEKQWNVVENAYNALSEGGLAIFILNKEENDYHGEILPDGYVPVGLQSIKENLQNKHIDFHEMELKLRGVEKIDIEVYALIVKK